VQEIQFKRTGLRLLTARARIDCPLLRSVLFNWISCTIYLFSFSLQRKEKKRKDERSKKFSWKEQTTCYM